MTSRHPPGPPGWPFAALRAYRRDPLGFVSRCMQDYGGLVHLRMAHRHVYLLSDPAAIEQVLVRQAARYRKGITNVHMRHVVGQGLIAADGDLWRRQRRLMQPFFDKRSLGAHVPAMALEAEAAVERLLALGDEPVDLYEAGAEIALRVIASCLLGVDAQPLLDSLRGNVAVVMDWVLGQATALVPSPLWWPSGRNRTFKRAMASLDRFVAELIAAPRSAAPDAPPTLLEALLAARGDPDDPVMDDRQVRDELLSNVLAGHESTACTLAWVLYELARRPEVRARLREEVSQVAGEGRLTAEHVPQLDYTRRVMSEAMRINPPTWAFTRDCLEPAEIGDYAIPRRAIMIVCQYTTHRNPAVWEDPERFDPDRFLPERVSARPKFAFIPFGGGKHQCIGGDFALVELTLTIAEIMRRLELTLVDESRVIHEPALALVPKHGVWVRVSPREGS